jgi:hypothetical protein
MILVGIAMYVGHGCVSTGPVSSCPVPPSVYEPAFALIGTGVLALTLGIALFINHGKTLSLEGRVPRESQEGGTRRVTEPQSCGHLADGDR